MGGWYFKVISFCSSPVTLCAHLSTTVLHVLPPQYPIAALVRSFNSRAEHLCLAAVSLSSLNVTPSHRQTIISSSIILLTSILASCIDMHDSCRPYYTEGIAI